MKYKETDVSIKDVQKVQLEILLEFDRICRKNDIPYQLFAGTLLGAVRHKGFIPWDDDIDVCLLRKDYQQFLKCCRSDLKDKYFLQYHETDAESILQFAKLRKNGTIFTNRTYQDSGQHNGIYIDIFPLDNVKPRTVLGKLHPWLFNVLYITGSSRLRARASYAKSPINRMIRLFFYYLLKLFPKKLIDKAMQATLCMFSKQSAEYVNHLTNGVSAARLKKYIREKKGFYDIIYEEFEGHRFPIPRNYHEVLERNFGDYMTLPPEDQRYPHHGIIEIVFDTTKETGKC